MIKVQGALLKSLSSEAKASSRKRMNYNFHQESSDPLQRMLNALEPDTYIRPHKHVHPDKREAFILLRGRIAVVEFDDTGKVTDYIILDHHENYAAEIIPGSWHTVISYMNDSVYYEVKEGPYDAATDKIHSDWSPAEGTKEAESYLNYLKKELRSV